MTTQELKRMNDADFFEHISEAFMMLKIEKEHLERNKGVQYNGFFPELQARHNRRMYIKAKAITRIEKWLKERIKERIC